MPNPEFYSARMRGTSSAKEIDDCLKEAESEGIGEAAVFNLKRLAKDRIRYLKHKQVLDIKWHRQHKVNGASQCQSAIAASQEFDELVMQPDPYGKYTGIPHQDPNAIALYTLEDALRVGYISAKPEEFGGREGGLAKWLSDRISSGEHWACYVVAKVGQGKASLGLRIELVQIKGTPVTDWPGEVMVESEPVSLPVTIDLAEMDRKLTEVFIHRNLLSEEARKEFRKIRAFRVKYGKYSEGCLEWLDAQSRNLEIFLEL